MIASIANSNNGISIHALREEGDRDFAFSPSTSEMNFYPRPPRGGRPAGALHGDGGLDISIHALREEGDDLHRQRARRGEISIHALREEGDAGKRLLCVREEISIHALREEGDSKNRDKISIFL